MRLIPCIGLLLLCVTTDIRAEPSASIKWLMNEPASMFDLGMLRMRSSNKDFWTPELMEELHGEKLTLGDLGVGSVVYSWDENTISITAPLIGEATENKCKGALSKYKQIISPWFDESVLFGGFTATAFEHINYANKSRPKDLNENLGKLLVLTVGISERLGGKSIYCSSRLGSDVPSFVKFGF